MIGMHNGEWSVRGWFELVKQGEGEGEWAARRMDEKVDCRREKYDSDSVQHD